MAKAKTYRVRTTGEYRGITDANRKVAVEGGEDLEVSASDYVGSLDDAQLAAVMADNYVRVDELDAKGNSKATLSDPAASAEPAASESASEPAESDGEDQAADDTTDSANDAPAASDEA